MMLLRSLIATVATLSIACLLSGCQPGVWNDPHATEDEGKIVSYSHFDEQPKHLDPARSFSLNESIFLDQIYEPPLQYHYLKRPYELEPATLTQMPSLTYLDSDGNKLPASEKNPAFSVYEFTLKKGIRFQPHASFALNDDGSFVYHFDNAEQSSAFQTLDDFTELGTKELVADDYIYQIKRLGDPKRLNPLRALFSQYIVGMSEFSAQVSELRKNMAADAWLDLRTLELEGATKIDDYRFKLTLKGKYPQFKYWLATGFFAPIPWQVDRFYHLPGLAERNITLNFHPVGTGPYMMTVNDPNAQIVLEKNPNFREDYYPTEGEEGDEARGLLKDAGKRLPFIDKFVYRLEKEAIPTWTKFMQGYYDRAVIGSSTYDQAVNVSTEGIHLSPDMQTKEVVLQRIVRPSTYYMGFNMLDSVVGGLTEQGRKLRQAVSIAYNMEEYIKIFLSGRGESALSPIPPGIYGYQKATADIVHSEFEWLDGKLERKSIEYAQQLLAEAGYPNGRNAQTGEPLVLNLDTMSGGDNKAWFSWMKKRLKMLGVQLNIRATDYNRFKDKMETANAQMFFWGWGADYPDPENFLFLLYGPNAQIDSKSGVNATNYKNPEYDALFEKMRLQENTPEREQTIKEMLAILQDDKPMGPAFHPYIFALGHSWVGNDKLHSMTRGITKYRTIDVEKRAAMQQQWNKPTLWPIVVTVLFVLALIYPAVRSYQRRQKRTISSSAAAGTNTNQGGR